MNIKQICDGIYYAGVNDRVTEKFEAMWPLPNGVSYNSYIVKGTEKTALIDTVEVGYVLDFLSQIKDTIGEAKIDYIVINHMEPDHSGSIPLLMEHYPDARLVGNKQTIGMVKGFYGIGEERCLQVNEGDELDLGGMHLKTVLTPMVHWPETMMTLVPERKVLFSGDAFGCFGALNGGIVDNEMETGWYRDEMYRYYSNIVGKYGKFVQKAMKKLEGVDLDYICSTHGPVWHDKIGEVTDIYDRLSRYEPEAGVTIVYGSMYGNTAEIAEETARQLTARGVRNIKMHNAATSNLSYMISDAFRYEGLIIGSATYSMHIFPPVEQFVTAMETREIKNKTVGLYGSFTWASGALPLLKAYVEKMGITHVAELLVKQRMWEETKNEIAVFADKFVESLRLK